MCTGGAGGDVYGSLFLQVDLADTSLNACSQPAGGLFSLKAKLIRGVLHLLLIFYLSLRYVCVCVSVCVVCSLLYVRPLCVCKQIVCLEELC